MLECTQPARGRGHFDYRCQTVNPICPFRQFPLVLHRATELDCVCHSALSVSGKTQGCVCTQACCECQSPASVGLSVCLHSVYVIRCTEALPRHTTAWYSSALPGPCHASSSLQPPASSLQPPASSLQPHTASPSYTAFILHIRGCS